MGLWCARSPLGFGQCGDWVWGNNSLVWGWEWSGVSPSFLQRVYVDPSACSDPPRSHPPSCLLGSHQLGQTDLRPWSCLSLTRSPPGWLGLSVPVPAPPETPALPWTHTLASHPLTHPLLPPGPLHRPALSLGGFAPTTASGLTQTSPRSPVLEHSVPCGPMTHRVRMPAAEGMVSHLGHLGGGGDELPLA